VIRVAAALAFGAFAAGGCGGTSLLTTRDVSGCLADRSHSKCEDRRRPRGFLIFVEPTEEAKTLEQDITTHAPTESEQRLSRACLKD
jgi:hypothetical protein